MTATILKDNVKDVLTRHSGPHRMPFADYLSSSVTLVCDSHADFTGCSVCLKCTLAIAKVLAVRLRQSQSRPSFLGECDVPLHGCVGLAQNIHRVAKDFDFGSGCTLF
jgi:hypothetical protein